MEVCEGAVKGTSPYFAHLLDGFSAITAGESRAAGGGRGAFAARLIGEGEVILHTPPLVSHPAPECLHSVCYLCLRRVEGEQRRQVAAAASAASAEGGRAGPEGAGARGPTGAAAREPLFCGADCEAAARSSFLEVEESADWGALEQISRDSGRRWPLLARRLACMVLMSSLSANALRPFCYARPPSPSPEHWAAERGLLVRALLESGVEESALHFLTADWYARVMGCLQLNAFKVEIPADTRHMELLEAAAAAVQGTSGVGSALYAAPSLLNHDCDPNVSVIWWESAHVALHARRDIQEGEGLRITYLDSSMGYEARQRHLLESYGFACRCSRCLDRD